MKKTLFKLYSFFYYLAFGRKPKRSVQDFKKLILSIHDGIPSYYFRDINKNIREDELRKYYLDHHIIQQSNKYRFHRKKLSICTGCDDPNCKPAFFLGHKGMVLANSYSNENLTFRVVILTIIIVILTLILLFSSKSEVVNYFLFLFN